VGSRRWITQSLPPDGSIALVEVAELRTAGTGQQSRDFLRRLGVGVLVDEVLAVTHRSRGCLLRNDRIDAPLPQHRHRIDAVERVRVEPVISLTAVAISSRRLARGV
jgi:hypothetical protein